MQVEFPSPAWFKDPANFEKYASHVSFMLIGNVTSLIMSGEDADTALNAGIEICIARMREDNIPILVIQDFIASYAPPERRKEFLAPCVERARVMNASLSKRDQRLPATNAASRPNRVKSPV